MTHFSQGPRRLLVALGVALLASVSLAQNENPSAAQAPPENAQSVPDLAPQTREATANAARRYAQIAESGGWPRVPPTALRHADEKTRSILGRRLAIEGDLADERESAPDALSDALKKFQQRTGLNATGKLDKQTLRELNVPARRRARQLDATLRRLSAHPVRFGPRYVAVNIPAAEVEAVEDGKVVRRYVAIVGKADHPSPEVTAKILSIKLNPTWTIPVSIIRAEVAPKLRRDPAYLERAHIRVFDARGREIDPRRIHWSKGKATRFTFRQDPGEKNALGALRISMPNRQDVYMHDTPKKSLFDRNYRFLSHGCVRVEDVYDLAAWLLQGTHGDWDRASILQAIDTGERRELKLAKPAQAIWVYMTGWATPDGIVHFRRDIYKLDDGARHAHAKASGT